MDEPFVPGAYTVVAPDGINIRTQMNTYVGSNVVGGYKNSDPFVVFEVYPEVNGIVWGRVSSNVGGGVARFVGLRVNNHPKAKLEKAFAAENVQEHLAEAIRELAAAIRTLANSD